MEREGIQVKPAATPRYAIRVTGPAGYSSYVTLGGGQSDDHERAYHYSTAGMAWQAAASWRRQTTENVVCDVVNVDDPEDKCSP